MSLEVPRTLPVPHLSHSSIRTYLRCPEKWRRRYIDLEYEPSNANLVIGKCVGAGISGGYIEKINQEPEYGEAMLDIASDTFEDVTKNEEIDWQEDAPEAAKDSIIRCVGRYYEDVATRFTPATVEEGFEIGFPEADWIVKGFIDITGEAAGVSADLHDVKTVSKADNTLDSDVQATLYVASYYVRDESLPIFAWHQIKKPTARNAPEVRLLTTSRTATQVTNYLERIAQVAREIDWRVQTGNWQGAVPGTWWCSQKFCGYWDSCPYGGAR